MAHSSGVKFPRPGNSQQHNDVVSSGRSAEHPRNKYFGLSANLPPPSKSVRHQEDENMKANQELGFAGLSLDDQNFPPRPGYGTEGQNITLATNYFHLIPDKAVKIHRYSIDINPAPVSRKRRQIISLFLQTPSFQNIGLGVATDYSTIIVTANELDLSGNSYLEESVLYRDELELRPRLNAATYKVKLSPTGLANVAELLSFLSSPPSRNVSQFESMATAISAMNVAVTQFPNASSTVVSGSRNCKFFPLDCGSVNLGGGLVAIRGYYSSVRGCTTRLLVNVNVCTSAFYPNVDLVEVRHAEPAEWQRELAACCCLAHSLTLTTGIVAC